MMGKSVASIVERIPIWVCVVAGSYSLILAGGDLAVSSVQRGWGGWLYDIVLGSVGLAYGVAGICLAIHRRWASYVFTIATILLVIVFCSPIQISTTVWGEGTGSSHIRVLPLRLWLSHLASWSPILVVLMAGIICSFLAVGIVKGNQTPPVSGLRDM